MKKTRKNNRNEEMMFLGIDGFEEIESLFPEATKKAAPRRRAKPRKKSLADATAKMKTSKALRAAKVIPAPAHQEGGAQPRRVYKKRAVLAVAAGVTAAMFSFATVANAMGTAETAAPTKAATSPAQPAAAQPECWESPISITGFEESPVPEETEQKETLFALYIDDAFVGVVTDGAALHKALDQILLDAKEGFDDTTTTEFLNKVELLPYEGEAEAVPVGDLLDETRDMLSVLLETDWMYEEEIPYETDIIYDDTQPEGYEEVLQEGQNGVIQYQLRLSYIDGEQTDFTINSEEVLSEPVTEQLLIGTGTPAVTEEETVSDSGFLWPLPHTHNITSLMGERWGRMHNGIDIAGGDDYGQPFVAADSGTVVWSGNDGGGYGNYVMIDHGNGYMTVYGHASELACSTGDTVSQGEVIGYVGSTGNSTGPHLHFEIRLDGEYQDPLNYVC